MNKNDAHLSYYSNKIIGIYVILCAILDYPRSNNTHI